MAPTESRVCQGAGPARPARPADTAQGDAKCWPHPYDTATGTIALGVLLTAVLAALLPFVSG